MPQFIIDSGAFLALLNAKDRFHPVAKQFALANREAVFFIPEFIFAETMTLIKARLGSRQAIQLGESIQASAQFQLVPLTDDMRQVIWSLFSRYADKDWSYPDCSLLALAQQMGVTAVFSFDHHIEQMAGLTRVP
ncbi:MAG: type II toxin-antitoxin system VapC family toxin [Chloroflexi bacterium]|nr:type II toxin-antitoxin system VapC family toxin [Chloroflexota bacterium]MBK6712274.1 type II toxin-antitoxin system VapC family toxin [Chloroflexota bacterium]MBK8933531.1 type II toxin-antitoxin system VapC family toxin [Chloroflexota bacterium]